MNQDIKVRWVAALRDPESVQGQSFLGTPEGKRCCLGVLCDLAVQDGVIAPPAITTQATNEVLQYDGVTQDLPPKVRTWADLVNNDDDDVYGLPSAHRSAAERKLINLNDNDGADFPSIAEHIEREL